MGSCLLGTGDPYFVAAGSDDLPVYRIPHTAVDEHGALVLTELERVAPSLEAFLSLARVR